MVKHDNKSILLAKKMLNFMHLKHANKQFFRVIIIFKVKITFLENSNLSYENVLN